MFLGPQKMAERRRKSSLHAFVSTKALHLKPKVFFTSSPNSGSLACEVVTFSYRSISLVKRSAYAAREVSASGGLMCFCLKRFAYTAASRLVFWSPKNGGTKTQVFTSRFCVNKSSSLKTEGFLHIFTKLRKPCL